MSIAKLLIGQKPEAKPAAQQETVEERPLTARELIDSIAEAEFLREEDGVGKPKDGEQPETGEVPKGKGKKTPGQVAPAPTGSDPVKYGKK